MKCINKFRCGIVFFGVLVILAAIFYFVNFSISADQIYDNSGNTQVTNLTSNWQDYKTSNSTEVSPQVPKYEKYELTFNIDWYKNRQFGIQTAKYDPMSQGILDASGNSNPAQLLNPYWPYDESPAANIATNISSRGDGKMPVTSGIGINVDALLLSPGTSEWSQATVQPGFYTTNYASSSDYRTDWSYPVGSPVWKIRFAPTEQGVWKYIIRIKDKSGITYSQIKSITCVSSQNHGFVKVSPTDNRYFETSDGTYIPIVGASDPGSTKQDAMFSTGVNLIRSWWQSSNPEYALFGGGGQGGDMIVHNLNYTTEELRPGTFLSSKIPSLGERWTEAWNNIFTYVDVKKNTNYRLSAWIKTKDLAGSGSDVGAFIGVESFGSSPKISGTNDWTQVNYDFNSENRDSMRMMVGIGNATSGSGYLSSWSLKENLGNNNLGTELIPRSDLSAHTSFNQQIAGKIDTLLEKAKTNNAYVKAVIEEKSDSFYKNIQANGTWGEGSDDNVYANDTSANRVYQQYYWRYLIARYSYSTALQSYELFNEADPFNGNHENAVNALGKYLSMNDPYKHLATTSNWHSFPPLMWRNNNIGIADLHMYLGTKVPMGGNRLIAGWDGSLSAANNLSGLINGFSFDKTISHTGKSSLKATVPALLGTSTGELKGSGLNVLIGAPSGHTLKVSMWVKGDNLITYNKDWMNPGGIHMQYSQGGGDFAGYPSVSGPTYAPWGTYDWQKIEYEIAPTNGPTSNSEGRTPTMIDIAPVVYSTNSARAGTLWIDDFSVQDLTSGLTMNYNGSFEETEPEGYDIVAGHASYSRLAASYQLGKPVMRSETGIAYPSRYGAIYKGFTNTEEDQALVDDTAGIWWRKLVWSNLDSGGLNEIYWWTDLLTTYKFQYAKYYKQFMDNISLSNGKYKDLNASSSDPALRVFGQKEMTSGKAEKAHLWVDNANQTWKKVVDKAEIASASGDIAIPDMENGDYTLEWWDPGTGKIASISKVTIVENKLKISITNLSSDVAIKLYRGGQLTKETATGSTDTASTSTQSATTDTVSTSTTETTDPTTPTQTNTTQTTNQNQGTSTEQAIAPVDKISITVFHYNATGVDAYNLNDEYVTIYNSGKAPVSTKDWVLKNTKGDKFIIPSYNILPQSSITIYSGKKPQPKCTSRVLVYKKANGFWGIKLLRTCADSPQDAFYMNRSTEFWNNNHDKLTIYNKQNILKLEKSY